MKNTMMNLSVMRISRLGIIFFICLGVLMLMYAKSVFIPSTTLAHGASQTICLKQLLVASIETAKRGGKKVVQVKKQPNFKVGSKGKTLEGVNDPVTLGDMLSHQQMYYSLLKMWPDLRVVSEEKSENAPDPKDIKPLSIDTEEIERLLASTLHSDVRIDDVTVWIDPLDATKEYTENLLDYVTTMVCVAVKGKPVIGVIHRPFQEQTIWAWRARGKSSIPDFQTNVDDLRESVMKIIVSLSHKGQVEATVKKAFGNDTQIVSAGGAGYKALNVAQRKVHAYVHTTAIKKWDICAGHALLSTMGGHMTDIDGNEIDYSFPRADRKDVKLKKGLIASLKDHKKFIDAFRTNSVS